MEHPFKIIGKAFGITLLAFIAFMKTPLIFKKLGTTEWQFIMLIAILFIALMLIQINTNASILLTRQRAKSNH